MPRPKKSGGTKGGETRTVRLDLRKCPVPDRDAERTDFAKNAYLSAFSGISAHPGKPSLTNADHYARNAAAMATFWFDTVVLGVHHDEEDE